MLDDLERLVENYIRTSRNPKTVKLQGGLLHLTILLYSRVLILGFYYHNRRLILMCF